MEGLNGSQRAALERWLASNGYTTVEAEEWFQGIPCTCDGPHGDPVDAELTAWSAMEASTSYEEDQQ